MEYGHPAGGRRECEAGQEGTAPSRRDRSSMELKRFFRAPLLLIAVAVLLLLFVLDYANSGSSYQQTDTSQIVSLINQGQVKSAVITDKNQTIQITTNKPIQIGTQNGTEWQASWVSGQGLQLANELQHQKDLGHLPGGYTVNIPKSNALLDLLPTAFIYLVIFLLFFFMLSQMQGGGSRVMNFGKSRAKLITKDTPKTTFADVAGADEAIEELQEIKEFLQNPAKFQAIGAKIPKGVLLYGPPGIGKTLLARAVAGEAGVPFYSISGSDFVEMFVGVGASRVRDLFEQARRAAPCIIFIDELDALGRSRMPGALGGYDEKEQTLNQLLAELDGFDPTTGVILLAATNRPEVLDPALLRPGRFDRQVLVDRPDRAGRREILKVHTAKVQLARNVDLDQIAGLTPGFTGADLANLVNEAAIVATRRNGDSVTLDDFTVAIERIIAGLEKKSRVLGPEERRRVAYHEMGHALVAATLPGVDPVHKVSIIPRGVGALGYTIQRPTEDRFLLARHDLESRISVLMGGRAAEALIFDGEVSTGASDDLQRATEIATEMVTRYGMNETVGPRTYAPPPQPFLTGTTANRVEASEATEREIDVAVRDIVARGFDRAADVLRARRSDLDDGARLLLTQETVTADQFPAIRSAARETTPAASP